jgi:hypothetical protein
VIQDELKLLSIEKTKTKQSQSEINMSCSGRYIGHLRNQMNNSFGFD